MDGVSEGDSALSKRAVPICDLGVVSLRSVNMQLVGRLLGEINVRRETCELVAALDTIRVTNLALKILQVAEEGCADKIGLADVDWKEAT